MRIEAGSLVFFSGRQFISRAIAVRTCSWPQLLSGQWFSHAGIVYQPQQRGSLWLAESTSINGGFAGVQVSPLDSALAGYNGHVWYCPLNQYNRLYLRLSRQLTHCIMDKVGQGYDTLGAAICGTVARRWFSFNPHTAFCSELCVWLLRQIDVEISDPRYSPGFYSPAALARASQRCSLFDPITKIK